MSVSVTLQSTDNTLRRAPAPAVVLELLKPVTWFPPMWAFTCGAISSGISIGSHGRAFVTGIILTGPLVCAASQAVNDWYDRHVDAINEPNRPIPSGRVPGMWGLAIAIAWTALSLAVGATLGVRGIIAASIANVLAWAYSAPPLRLKRNGWYGNLAVGLSYEGLAWLAGAALLLAPALPSWRLAVVALMYSIGAHGIMTLNDFKSIEGDAVSGVRSLPVQLGARRAGLVACAMMLGPQLVVVALLLRWSYSWQAAAVTVLAIVQIPLMRRLLQSPKERAPWYNQTGVTLYVAGMMLSAFALRAVAQ